MAVKRKTEAGAPAFTGAQFLTFDRYRERRDLLGVLLDRGTALHLFRGGRAH